MHIENFGQLLPVWLLGAPLILGLIELMRTPRARVDRYRGGTPAESAARPMGDPVRR